MNGDRVIHIASKLYGRLEEFCRINQMDMSSWVEETIGIGLDAFNDEKNNRQKHKASSVLSLVVPKSPT